MRITFAYAASLLFASLTPSHTLLAEEGFSLISVPGIARQSSPTTQEHVIQVELLSTARCMFGDLDALLLDIERFDKSAILQLTLEPLPVQSFPPIVAEPLEKKLTAQSLGAYDVKLPKTVKPGIYGLFLCSAPAKSSRPVSCAAQQLMDINTMLQPYRVNTKDAVKSDGSLGPAQLTKTSRATATYKIYYFQPIIVKDNTAYTIARSLDAPGYESLASHLRTLIPENTAVEKSMDDIRRFSEKLGSIPLELTDNRFAIRLPYYSRKKCLGK